MFCGQAPEKGCQSTHDDAVLRPSSRHKGLTSPFTSSSSSPVWITPVLSADPPGTTPLTSGPDPIGPALKTTPIPPGPSGLVGVPHDWLGDACTVCGGLSWSGTGFLTSCDFLLLLPPAQGPVEQSMACKSLCVIRGVVSKSKRVHHNYSSSSGARQAFDTVPNALMTGTTMQISLEVKLHD